MLKLSRYCVASEPFADSDSGHIKHVIMSGRTGEVRVIDAQAWDNLTASDEGYADISPQTRYELTEIEALVPEGEDELSVILSRNEAAQKDSRLFYLVIQPTASCQLGCGYCGQEHTNQILDTADTKKLVDLAEHKLSAGDVEVFQVGWFGAEPLNALNKVYELSAKFQKLSERHGCAYGAKVVTNGVKLKHGVAARLNHTCGVKMVEITLDGDKSFHDKRRFTKKQRPSFDKIYQNLLAVARDPDIDFRLNIRCNVDEENVDGVFPLIERLADDGLQDRIQFYTAPVHSWGNDAHLRAVEKERYARWEVECIAFLVNKGFRPSIVPNRKDVVCLAAMDHGLLVDAYGEAFDCTEVSFVPTYGDDNVFKIGAMNNGVDQGARSIFKDYAKGVAHGDYPCGSCEILPLCGGSCPKQWNEGLCPCPPTKFNIRERMLLHYCASKLQPAG